MTMTKRQALAEARRRWGKSAAVKENLDGAKHQAKCKVGIASWIWSPRGQGDTWEEAFADADRGAK